MVKWNFIHVCVMADVWDSSLAMFDISAKTKKFNEILMLLIMILLIFAF